MSIREILEGFVRHTDSLDEKGDDGRDGFERDFAELKQRSLEYKNTYSSSAGQKLYNGVKNRYKDILPFEYTRVPLQPLPGMTGSDYINANYVKGVSGHNTYIAAQAPLPTSVIDFWRMIWENEVKVVLMACNLREAGKTKCEKYWPELDREVQFGDVLITLVKEDHQSPDYTLRELEVRKANICKVVYQLHYTAWPDHGVPDHYDYILDLVAEAREKQQQENLPIVVHCSAGCGRTGTIIAIDYCWSLLKKGKLTKDFNLFNVIDEMRRQRPSAVQTPDQYWFVFMAVKELFERHLRIIEKHSYENVQVGEGSTYEKEDSYDPYENVDVFESSSPINQEDDYAIPEPAHGVVQAAASPFKNPSKPPRAAPVKIHPAEIAIEKTVAKLASKQADFLVPDSSWHVPRHPPKKVLVGPPREERREEYVNVDIPKSTVAETGKPLIKAVVKGDPLPVQGQTEVQKRDEYVNVDLPKRTSIKEMDSMPAAKATVVRKPSNESRNLQIADGVDQSSSYTVHGGTHVNAKVKSFEKTQSSVDASSTRKSSADIMQKGHQAVQDSSSLKGQNVTVIAVKGENQEGRIFDRKDPVSPVMPYAIGNVHLKENAHYEGIWPVQKEQNLPTQEAVHIQISSKEDDARSQSVSELRQKLGSDLVLGTEQGKKSSTSEDHHKLNPLQKLKNKISGDGNLKSADHKKKKSFDEDKDHGGKDQHSKPHHEEKGGPLEHLKSAFQLGCGSCVSVDPAYAAVMQSQNAPLEKPPPHGVTPASDGFMKELKAAQGGLRTAEPENRASVNQQQHGFINKAHPIQLPSGVRKSQHSQAIPYAVSNVQSRNSTHETVAGSHASSSDDIQPYASSSEFGLTGKAIQRGHNNDYEDEVAAPYSVTSEMGLFGRKKQENSFPSKSSATPPVAHEYADPFLDSQSTVSESSGEYAEPYSTTRELFGKRSSQNDARPPALIPKIEETKEPNSPEYSYSFEHCKQMPLSSPKGFFDNSSVGGPNPKAPPRKKRSSQDGSPQREGQTYEPVLLKSSERDVNPPGSRENRSTEVKQPFQRARAVSEDDDKPPPIPTKSEEAFLDVSQVKSYKRRSWDDKIWAEKYSCPPPVPIKTPEAYMLPRTRGQHYDGVMRYPPMTRSRSSTDNKYHSLERNFFSKKDVSGKPEESGPDSGGKPKAPNVFEKLMSKVPMKSNKGREPSLPTAGVTTPAVFVPFKTDSDEALFCPPSHRPLFKKVEFPHRNERKPQGPRSMIGAWKLP